MIQFRPTTSFSQPVTTNGSRSEVWDREYRQIRGIPSSTRLSPSKALCIVEPLLDFSNQRRVLDAGCGNGRNALHLATNGCEVVAVDFSDAAIEAASAICVSERNRVRLAKIDLLKTLPYETHEFDFCLDSYVSCHFTDHNDFTSYWSELARVTKPGGIIFSSMFCQDDAFYEKFLTSGPAFSIATDPVNQITKTIYTELQFKGLFQEPLWIRNFLKFQFTDSVYGENYRRSVLVALAQKRSM